MNERNRVLGYYNYTVILTYIGMLVGFTGIACVLDGRFHQAVLCLMIAGVCDMFDGTIAATRERIPREKRFGIQIDSLSDLICFGALPALLVYSMNDRSSLSFLAAGLYVLCALIRLAYFNVDEEERQDGSSESRKYYQGLPVTLAALILPALFVICGLFHWPRRYIGIAALFVMGAAFLLPFRLKKPAVIGKICVVLCGAAELAFVLAGADV